MYRLRSLVQMTGQREKLSVCKIKNLCTSRGTKHSRLTYTDKSVGEDWDPTLHPLTSYHRSPNREPVIHGVDRADILPVCSIVHTDAVS